MQRELWHYREGKWTQTPWPEQLAAHPIQLKGDLYLPSGNKVLRDGVVDIRYGRRALPPLIRKIDANGKVETLDSSETIKLGPYRIPLDCAMASDCDGTVFAVCQDACEGTRKLGKGVLVYYPSGKAQYVPRNDKQPFQMKAFGLSKTWVAGGKRAWVEHFLMDMETLTSIDRLPFPGFSVIAATDDCVFAQHVSYTTRETNGPLMVYRGNDADPRNVLAGSQFAGIRVLIASAGTAGLRR